MASVPHHPPTVRGLQERAARALPAEYVECASGWWLRHSLSSSWWTGTVLPHADAERDALVDRVAAAERFYAARKTAATFQVSPGACPLELDLQLEAWGYRLHTQMSLQTASTFDVRAQASAAAPQPAGLSVHLREVASGEWFEAWRAVHGHGSDARSEWDMLGRVVQPSRYASVVDKGRVVAVGRAVADAGWIGVFGVATLLDARGQGAARSILASLADWATTQDADHMYLQVERENEPALRLYGAMCFSERCAYHYRTRGLS